MTAERSKANGLWGARRNDRWPEAACGAAVFPLYSLRRGRPEAGGAVFWLWAVGRSGKLKRGAFRDEIAFM